MNKQKFETIRKKLVVEMGILRSKQNMSYYHMQNNSGVDRANIPPILSGNAGCSLQTAIALSYALGYELKLVKKSDDEK